MSSNNNAIIGLFLIALIFFCISQGLAEDVNVPLEILWQKEIDCGKGISCSPGAIAINKDNNELFIMGISFRSAANPMDYSEGKLWLWKINGNGTSISKSSLEDIPVNLKTNLGSATRFIKGLKVCADGDIVSVGTFSGEKYSIMRTTIGGTREYLKSLKSSENIVEPNLAGRKNDDEGIILLKQFVLSDNNLLLVGKNNQNEGLAIKIDAQGNKIWDKKYDFGPEKVDFFTDGIPIGGKGDFLLAGCSSNVADKFPSEPSYVCLLLCDPEGNVILKKVFQGNPWPGRAPQLCKIGLGDDFVLAYDKSMNFKTFELTLEAFTPEFSTLWSKQIEYLEMLRPVDIKIKAASQNNFVVGEYVGSGKIKISEYDKQGDRQGTSTIDNISHNFSLDCTQDKAFVVLQTSTKKEKTSKIKVVAYGLKGGH